MRWPACTNHEGQAHETQTAPTEAEKARQEWHRRGSRRRSSLDNSGASGGPSSRMRTPSSLRKFFDAVDVFKLRRPIPAFLRGVLGCASVRPSPPSQTRCCPIGHASTAKSHMVGDEPLTNGYIQRPHVSEVHQGLSVVLHWLQGTPCSPGHALAEVHKGSGHLHPCLPRYLVREHARDLKRRLSNLRRQHFDTRINDRTSAASSALTPRWV